MDFGAFMFHTDYSMPIIELAQACEARGFESLWAPEHSHIPLSRKSPFPGGGDVPKMYYDAMDPFVILAAAAAATKTLKIGTGVCLVIQRDTIQTAKSVASLDQVSGGRFIFGIGGGWNVEEVESHGTPFETRMLHMREQIEAMKEIWTKSTAEYHGETVEVVPMMTWPKPMQKPYPPVIVGGAFPWAARRAVRYGDGWYPNAAAGDPEVYMPAFKKMCADGGRPALPVTLGGAPMDADKLKRFRDLGAAGVNTGLMSEPRDQILPVLDKWAGLMRAVNA